MVTGFFLHVNIVNIAVGKFKGNFCFLIINLVINFILKVRALDGSNKSMSFHEGNFEIVLFVNFM